MMDASLTSGVEGGAVVRGVGETDASLTSGVGSGVVARCGCAGFGTVLVSGIGTDCRGVEDVFSVTGENDAFGVASGDGVDCGCGDVGVELFRCGLPEAVGRFTRVWSPEAIVEEIVAVLEMLKPLVGLVPIEREVAWLEVCLVKIDYMPSVLAVEFDGALDHAFCFMKSVAVVAGVSCDVAVSMLSEMRWAFEILQSCEGGSDFSSFCVIANGYWDRWDEYSGLALLDLVCHREMAGHGLGRQVDWDGLLDSGQLSDFSDHIGGECCSELVRLS